jgi:hypothetical protein
MNTNRSNNSLRAPVLPKETLGYFGVSRDEIRPAGELANGAPEAKQHLREFCALTQPQQRQLVPYLAHMGFRKPFFSANWRSAMIVRTLLHEESPEVRSEALRKVLLALASPAWLAKHQEPLFLSTRLELSNHRLQILRFMQMICDGVIEREGQFHLREVSLAGTPQQKHDLFDGLMSLLDAAAAQTDVEGAKRLFSAWKRSYPGLTYPGEHDQLLQPTMFTAAELNLASRTSLESFGTMLVIMRMWCRFVTVAEASLQHHTPRDFALSRQISQKWRPIMACFSVLRGAAAGREQSAALAGLLGQSNWSDG